MAITRPFRPLLVGAAVLASISIVRPAAGQPSTTAHSTDTYRLQGLSLPGEILIDRWGVPHIYAQSLDDVFFLQGFNAARDRLWQLDLWKRRGDGTLSEVFGSAFVEKDRASRLLLYRGDMYREWLAYASDTKRIVNAFTGGINAFIELTETNPELLPPEFIALDYRPAHWQPETVVRIRSHGLLRNAASEWARARLLREHGPFAAALARRLEPAHELLIPDGLELGALPADPLAVYRLGTSGVPFDWLGPEPENGSSTVPGRAAALRDPPPLERSADFARGSNNWAIAPHRTATGRPILADDPHRTQAAPSLRYIAHLSAPRLDVIGAGEPALPGVSIGHNGRIAFGLTIFAIDQEDLYVYELHPDDDRLYRYRDRWERMESIADRIPVRGASPVEVELRFTRHGPVLWQEGAVAVALRGAWLEPGMAPYLGSIEYMRAQNWDDFLAAMNRWGAPSENQVYADTDGHIGWKPGGLAPIRPNWDGLLPVPGDGRYEWQGYRNMDELPVESDPPRGFVSSANQMNLPPDYPHSLGYEWAAPFRQQRIVEVLSADESHSLKDSLHLQTDYLSIPARRAIGATLRLEGGNETQSAALQLLRDWDFQLEADSAAAALFEVWWRIFLPKSVYDAIAEHDERLSPEAAASLPGRHDSEGLLQLLEGTRGGGASEGRLPSAALNAAVLSSLEGAFAFVAERLGGETQAWRWGSLHHAELEHPLAEQLDSVLNSSTSIGPLPRGGSGDTVGNTSYGAGFRQTSGASFRMVIDVGNWDASIAVNSPGQSGDPRSDHWDDLFSIWAADEAFPLLYSRAAVEAATERLIRLVPE